MRALVARPDHQHGAGRIPRRLVIQTTHRDRLNKVRPRDPHHDQIRAPSFRRLDDLFRGMAIDQHYVCPPAPTVAGHVPADALAQRKVLRGPPTLITSDCLDDQLRLLRLDLNLSLDPSEQRPFRCATCHVQVMPIWRSCPSRSPD